MNRETIEGLIDDCSKAVNSPDLTYLSLAKAVKEACDIKKLGNNNFYCKYGLIKKEEIQKIMLNALKEKVNQKDIKTLIQNSFFILDVDSYDEEGFSEILKPNIIPVKNGVIEIHNNDVIYKQEFTSTPYRLPINYNPNAPRPTHFLKWIDELFMPEDVKGFQEYLGYCLVPTKKAQKMLLLLGNGGEGKSIVGIVLRALLGVACVDTEVKALIDKDFTLQTLEYKLVAYQDDTSKEGIQKSDIFKKIVSNETPMMIEKKFIDKYESFIYSKLIACSNYPLIAKDDDGDGFFRRIYPIKVKPKSKTRINIADYHLPILNELEGVFNWCLEGLLRLMKNDFKFSESKRSSQMLNEMKQDVDTVKCFIDDMVIFDNVSKIDAGDIYKAYRLYCVSNGFLSKETLTQTKLTAKLTNIAEEYGFKRTRGENSYNAFVGIKLKVSESNNGGN